MASSVAAALGASVVGVASGEHSTEVEESDTPGAPSVKGHLKRFSTTAYGAEVTGPFVFEDGGLLYSLQHPSEENPEPFDRAGIGYFSGFQFELDGDNDDFAELSTPQTRDEQGVVRAGNGEYVLLAQGREPINGGEERLGVTQTPDGTDIIREDALDPQRDEQPFFRGTQYGLAASNPDCNQFVATNDEGTEGYLFTNWENSPGNVSRIPLSQDDDGEWEADLDDAINLANTDAFRALGGTRINCYGDLSPWGTMISSEENYAHPRVSLTHTVGDIVEAGSGEGLVAASQFWNRPNPSEIQEAVDGYYGDDAWSVQGYWALTGVEFLAYYLGAEPVDQGEDDENTQTPIGDVYPNPYRYGYHVDFRDPAADEPQPVKYYVMGRASWESPDILTDERTAYGCSDGDSKGIYKFIADEPIPSYDDPMDVEGSLYAPKITNDAASVADSGERHSPADVNLEVEWLEMGHASNAEIEQWISTYDDVTQVHYLEAHAETDWREDLETALEEADRAVVEGGNRSYISNDEIVEWAAQVEEHGPRGVDEDLRKVPFLETRAAAKEMGASIEFNKAEGVDSVDGAQPGDFVYFGISEFNDDLADDTGDIQMDRVDGGVVYRGELEADYNVSTLEPVIVGPDFTDPPEDADDALRNIDNVYVMDDGRVLCCEDGFGGPARSYPNDGLYVYQPNVLVDVESVTVARGGSATADVRASSLPAGFSGARLTVSVADPNVAAIGDVSFPEELGLAEAEVAKSGSSATFRVADVGEHVQPGGRRVTLASLDVHARGAGTTELEVEIHAMDDEDGDAIDAEARTGVVATGPPAVVGDHAPTDPDGDGHYEDVDGDGDVDDDDVQALFENVDAEGVTESDDAFDFNENGDVDYDDVVSLAEESD
ncbi:alkaline phosphatase PhoX [Halomarina ordinaria]|uniref:Alkaline phosphatase PhoX n=1 Tax=Halomarina ordinaria TaxID=3033939 RepID=A0ABD5U9L7_9EURY|nr:alkaline phosphatase PhoX [Halomarina sp. PSRA2]